MSDRSLTKIGPSGARSSPPPRRWRRRNEKRKKPVEIAFSLLDDLVRTYPLPASKPIWHSEEDADASREAASVAWEHPHGDSANRSYADVETAPAGAGSLSVPNLGSFAPGSGPVIAPEGRVYLGTSEGRLISLRANGSERWAAQLPPLQGIVSSPVVGGDGSIYVVAVSLPIRDHREGSAVTVFRAWLHKFAPSGERLWDIPFPEHRNEALPSYGPRLTGPPNIWRSGGNEYVIVPAVYRSYGREFYVVAFPARGGAPSDARISFIPDEITGTGFPWDPPIWWPFGFAHGVPYVPDIGLPPVAIYTYPGGGGTPWIMASDRVHDVVGLTFDPEGGFREWFRVRDANRAMLSAPSVLFDAHTALGTDTGEVVSPSNIRSADPHGRPHDCRGGGC